MRLNGVEYNDQSLGAYTEEPIGVYTAKAFFWMFLGLLTTFAVAFFGYATGTILYVFAIPYFHIVLLVVELGVVLFLSARRFGKVSIQGDLMDSPEARDTVLRFMDRQETLK